MACKRRAGLFLSAADTPRNGGGSGPTQLERMGGGNSRSQTQEKSEDEIARSRMNSSMRSWAHVQLLLPKVGDQVSATSSLKADGPESLPPVDPHAELTKELDRQLAKLIALCNAPEAIKKWKEEVNGIEKDLHQFKDSIFEARGTVPTGPNIVSQEPSIDLSDSALSLAALDRRVPTVDHRL